MSRTTDTDATLFEQLRPRLKAISCRIVGSEEEAEDVVQDCFFKWQGIEPSALVTPVAWLTTVVQHQSIDRLRKRARDKTAARAATELISDAVPVSPEDDLLRRAKLGEGLTRLLACLSPPERLALVLREVFECEHAEIAKVLGTNTVNARQYLARARRRLHEDKTEALESEKVCHELLSRFQAAINDMDVSAIVTLLNEEQPVSLRKSPRLQIRMHASACANDASYGLALAA